MATLFLASFRQLQCEWNLIALHLIINWYIHTMRGRKSFHYDHIIYKHTHIAVSDWRTQDKKKKIEHRRYWACSTAGELYLLYSIPWRSSVIIITFSMCASLLFSRNKQYRHYFMVMALQPTRRRTSEMVAQVHTSTASTINKFWALLLAQA